MQTKLKENATDGYETEYIDLDILLMQYIDVFKVVKASQFNKIKTWFSRLIKNYENQQIEFSHTEVVDYCKETLKSSFPAQPMMTYTGQVSTARTLLFAYMSSSGHKIDSKTNKMDECEFLLACQ